MTNAQVSPLPRKAPQWGFADRVRKIRRDVLDINQAQLAERLEVTRAAVEGWESGRNTPADIAAVAVKLERITGVPRTWFLGWSDNAPDDDSAVTGLYQPRKSQNSGARITNLRPTMGGTRLNEEAA